MLSSPAILDLRDEQAFLAAHHPDAVNIPLAEIPSRMHELPEKGQHLILFHDNDRYLLEGINLLSSRGYSASITREPLTAAGPSSARLWSASPLLIDALALHPTPGRALDVACGSGREAVHLVLAGWTVDALDLLPDALAKAAGLAARNGVRIQTLQRDILAHPELPAASYDLVSLFRFFDAPLIPHLIAALRPGGLLVIEAFHPEDANPAEHRRPERLVTPESLRSLLPPTLHIHRAAHITRNHRHLTQLLATLP